MVAAALIGAGASAAGKVADAIFGDKQADENWDRQKKVLKNQIQWKVEDATKAGLHPLAALGVVPASVGGTIVGSDFGSLGQDIGRAAEALMAPEDKTTARMIQLEVERGQLQNELLKSQIASTRMRSMQDATPGVPGIGPSGPTIGIPGTSAKVPVAQANAAQDAENHFGEIFGELFGIGNAAVTAWRYMNLERILLGDDVTPAVKATLSPVARDIAKGGYKSRYLGGR